MIKVKYDSESIIVISDDIVSRNKNWFSPLPLVQDVNLMSLPKAFVTNLKSFKQSTVDNVSSGNIKNQHRAHIETGTLDETRYIFEELKLDGPFTIAGVPVDAAKYVRSKFLAMYKTDPTYFWNNGSTSGWWQSVDLSGSISSETTLLSFLNNSDYNSNWLDFITVK